MANSQIAQGIKTPESKKSFFEVYKRNQGTYTRTGTAVGAGVMILAGGDFLYRQLAFESDAPWTLWAQISIPLAVLIIMGLLVWWVVGVYRKSCDFMIATEGEMKKVSWSSRKEVIGSTKVVIVFAFILVALLRTVDLVFVVLFSWMGVTR